MVRLFTRGYHLAEVNYDILQLRWYRRNFRWPDPVRRDTLGSAHGTPVLLTALTRDL